jgi:cytochrome bd-type quinol oxidase subunit 1
MYEAATAFFLESGFAGIMLFAEGRVSRGLYLSRAPWSRLARC